MSQQTTGRAALVANNLPSSKTITTASNATPIVVTTSTPHLLSTNEIVAISGVSSNSAANGTFIVIVLSGTTFSLTAYPAGTSVVGVGAGTGGTVQSNGYGITVPVPNDLTDAMRAGGINVPFEAGIDREAYLLYRAGVYGVIETELAAIRAQVPFVTSYVADLTSGASQDVTAAATDSSFAFVDFPAAVVGDVINAEACIDYRISNAAGGNFAGDFRLIAIQDYGGAATRATIPGSAMISYLTLSGSGDGPRARLALVGLFTVATAGPLRVILNIDGGSADHVTTVYQVGGLRASRTHIGY